MMAMLMLDRRSLILGAGAVAGTALAARSDMADLHLPGGPGARALSSAFPGKRDMIVQRWRPPLLETPFDVFGQGIIIPNDRFFVRWAGGVMPTMIDPQAFRLTLRGAVKRSVQLSLAEVARAGETIEVTAVNQCAGNGRGFQEPRVVGAQWAHGAMGNAVWRGVRLRDLLDRAGLGADAKRVRFAGLDVPATPGAPQKIKSIPIDIARRDDVIVAWAMNGEMLPLLNGYPLRLVVPGWFATYWIKMLSDIEVLSVDADDSYFMAKSYRMPAVPVKPGDKDFPTVPITTMGPRSWITSHSDGARLDGRSFTVSGIAMGGDCGVAQVDVAIRCTPGGPAPLVALPCDALRPARLDAEQGSHSFRRWSLEIVLPDGYVAATISPRCTNTNGVSQPGAQPWNPSGYARTVVEPVTVSLT